MNEKWFRVEAAEMVISLKLLIINPSGSFLGTMVLNRSIAGRAVLAIAMPVKLNTTMVSKISLLSLKEAWAENSTL